MVIKSIRAKVSDRDEIGKQIRRAGELVRELEMIFFRLPNELQLELIAEDANEFKAEEHE